MPDEMTEAIKREVTPIWKRLDEYRQDIRELERGQSRNSGKIETLESQLNAISESMSQHRDETREGFKKINASLDHLGEQIAGLKVQDAKEQGKADGRSMSRREMAAWATATVGGLSVAWQVIQAVA